jgi:hypothetical protein
MRKLRSMSPAETRVVLVLLAAFAAFVFVVAVGGTYVAVMAQGRFDTSGSWTARTSQKHPGEIQLDFTRRSEHGGFSNNGNTYKFNELSGLNEADTTAAARVDVKFTLIREAGTLVCDGMFVDRMGTGFWKFTANEAFRSDMKRRGYGSLTDDEMLRATFSNLNAKYMDDLKSAGYTDLDLNALMRAANHEISPAYIREMRAAYSGLTMEELIRARNHDIDAAYLKKVSDMGFGKQPLETVIRLSNHEISPEYITSMRSAGFTNVSVEELIRLKNHEVTPEFVSGIKAEGFSEISPDLAVRLVSHDVDRVFIQKAKAQGYTNVSLDEMIRLKDRGRVK